MREAPFRWWRWGTTAGPLRRIVLAAKHSARTDVTDFLDEAGARLGTALASGAGRGGVARCRCGFLGGEGAVDWERGGRVGGARALVVEEAPAGRQVALPLARAVARALAAGARPGVRVRVVDAVRLRVGATSQSGKAGAQRTVGRMGSMRALAVPPRWCSRCGGG